MAEKINDDGGCAVDWTWLNGERVVSVRNSLDALTITFESGLVFTTRALLYQGQPFLGFNPHAPPASKREAPLPVAPPPLSRR